MRQNLLKPHVVPGGHSAKATSVGSFRSGREDKTGKRVTKFQADTQSGQVGGTRPRPGEGRGQLPPAVAGGLGGLRARARSWLGRGSAIPEDSSAAGKGLRAEQRPRGGLGVQRDARRRRGGRE